MDIAQALLVRSIPFKDPAHPHARARCTIHDGNFYKGYPTELGEDIEIWHGYPVRRERVSREIPARVLRELVKSGELSKSEYKRLLGSAR